MMRGMGFDKLTNIECSSINGSIEPTDWKWSVLENHQATKADNVTELDVKRKAAYVATLVLAALCAPIPAGVL